MNEETGQVEATQEVVETTPEIVETQTEETEQATVETPQPTPAAPEVDRYSQLMKALGEVPEEPNQQLLESIDEKTIEQLPDSVKGMMKHLMAQQQVVQRKRLSEIDSRAKRLTERSQRVNDETKDLLQKRYELNRVLMDPKFQQYLKQAQVPEEQMEDPFTPEGIKQRIDKGVAKAMTEFQKPIVEAAERARQISKYQDFVDSNPQMKDASFKKEVRTVMESRKETGQPVSLEDAYMMVDRERLIKAEETRKQKELTARARSNKKISRATVSSRNNDSDPVPKWVTEKGYKGKRGASGRIQYLSDHPEKLKLLRDQQKKGLR